MPPVEALVVLVVAKFCIHLATLEEAKDRDFLAEDNVGFWIEHYRILRPAGGGGEVAEGRVSAADDKDKKNFKFPVKKWTSYGSKASYHKKDLEFFFKTRRHISEKANLDEKNEREERFLYEKKPTPEPTNDEDESSLVSSGERSDIDSADGGTSSEDKNEFCNDIGECVIQFAV